MEYMTKETAVALMIAAGNQNDSKEQPHPDILTYTDTDPDYEIPESIAPETGETFDSVTERYILDIEDYDEFDSTKQYEVGDILKRNNTIYTCIVRHLGIWVNDDFEATEYKDVVWGVGVINKGQDDETVNRLIYPDFSQISLINFNGVSGLG